MLGLREIVHGIRLVVASYVSGTHDVEGAIYVQDDTGNKIKTYLASAKREITVNDLSQTLTNKTIDSDSNVITNIIDADIKSTAAIARSKLAAGTASHVVINHTDGTFSSEAALANTRGGLGTNTSAWTGLVKVSAGTFSAASLIDADVSAVAAIARSKLATGTASHVVINHTDGTFSSEATLANSRGGLGANASAWTGLVKVSAGTFSAASLIDADISAVAAIARSKIAAGTASHVVINHTDGTLTSEATLASSRGGLGANASSWTGLAYASSGTFSALSINTGLSIATTNLNVDLSTGKAGGQSVIGGTAASENLTLSSTANATKGNVNLGTSSYYSEVNDRLALGSTTESVTVATASNTGKIKSRLGGAATALNAIFEKISATVASGASIIFARAKGTPGSEAVVAADDILMEIQAAGYDGTDYALGAKITAEVDGTPGAGDMPTRLVFSVSADGAEAPSEAMRIDKNKHMTLAEGAFLKQPSAIQFDTTPTGVTHTEGQLYFNATNKTLSVDLDGDVTLPVGQEEQLYVLNNSGGNILNGEVVYLTGSSGGLPTIAKAKADAEATSFTAGIATQDINDSANGYICVRGIVDSLNTNAFTVGDNLYLSETTAGAFTNTQPGTGYFTVRLGRVLVKDASTGSIYVRQIPFQKLSSLSDVKITSPVVNDRLSWNGIEWINTPSGSISAGAGVDFYIDDTTIIGTGANNDNEVNTLNKYPTLTTEVVDAISCVSNTVLKEAYLYNTALGGANIDAGTWDFNIWCSVSSTGGGRVSTISQAVYQVTPSAGGETVTTTGTGTSRTATITGATPFVAGDANADITLRGYLQTPQGLYGITAYTSSSEVTISVPSGYANESGVAYSKWLYLFKATTPTITTITTNYALFTVKAASASYVLGATDKLGTVLFGTSNNTTTVYFVHNGSTRYSYFKTPLITRHNDLSGLQGGGSTERYHLTSAQHTIATQAATGSVAGYLASADWTTFNSKASGTGTNNIIPKYTTGASAIIGDSLLSDNGTTLAYTKDAVEVGDNTATDKTFKFKKGGSDPVIKWDNALAKLRYSNNGTDFYDFGSAATSYAVWSIVSKSSDYTITDTDTYQIIIASGSGTDITLPTPGDNTGRIITITRNDNSNVITIKRDNASDTINGIASDVVLEFDGDTLTFLAVSANTWRLW